MRNMWPPPALAALMQPGFPLALLPLSPSLGRQKPITKQGDLHEKKQNASPGPGIKAQPLTCCQRHRLSKLRARPLMAIRDVMVSYFFYEIKSDKPSVMAKLQHRWLHVPYLNPSTSTGLTEWSNIEPILAQYLACILQKSKISNLGEDSAQRYLKPKRLSREHVSPKKKKRVLTLYQADRCLLKKPVKNLETCMDLIACLIMHPIAVYPASAYC